MLERGFSSISNKKNHALEAAYKRIQMYKMYIIVAFGSLPLTDEFILCENYESLLQYCVQRLAAGAGQSKSASNRD